jgi:hypothetical protein
MIGLHRDELSPNSQWQYLYTNVTPNTFLLCSRGEKSLLLRMDIRTAYPYKTVANAFALSEMLTADLRRRG